MSEDRKEFFYVKNKINYKNQTDNDVKRDLYQKLWDSSDKSVFKHIEINPKPKSNKIDLKQSHHAMKLQRSRYIMIDDEILPKKEHTEELYSLRGYYT